MIFPFPCTNIYYRYTDKRGLDIIFLHAPSGNAIYYDGWNYAFVQKASFDRKTFTELNYSTTHQAEVMMIEGIHADFDISFIRFFTGDIFQLTYMMDNEHSPQRLFIFSPGKPGYEHVLKSFQETAPVEPTTEGDDPSVTQWFAAEDSWEEQEDPVSSTQYFKRDWEETSGETATDSWGLSTFYFAADENYNVLQQLQQFSNGNVLKYDENYLEDALGGLSHSELDAEEFEEFRITREEFYAIWNNTSYRRFPEIVCTADVSWGQPRLAGRRLTVGDIVSLIDGYDPDITVTLTDHELTMQQVRQALHYCKDLQCKQDNPEKYCHNCLLRLYQTGETLDPSDPGQPNWQRAAKLYEQYFGSPRKLPPPPPPASKPWWKFW